MKITKLPRKPWVYILLTIELVVLAALMPRTAKFGFEYRLGAAWKYETLSANMDFPVLKSQSQIAEETASKSQVSVPYFRFSQEVALNNIGSAKSSVGSEYLRSTLTNALRTVYSRGVVADGAIPQNVSVIYVNKDKKTTKVPAAEVYTVTQALKYLRGELSSTGFSVNVDSLLLAGRFGDMVTPNLEFDEQMTALVAKQNQVSVSTTSGYVSAGDVIIKKGEIVTEELRQVLDSYKAEYESTVGSDRPAFLLWLGNILFVLGLLLAFALTVLLCKPEVFEQFGMFCYILFVLTLLMACTIFLPRVLGGYILAVPFALGAMYLHTFFRNRLVVPVYMIALVPLLATSDLGAAVCIISLVSGVVSCYYFPFFNHSWKQFIIAAIAFVFSLVAYFGCYLLGLGVDSIWPDVGLLAVSCVLTVVGYQLVFVFERMFGLVSEARLEDLANTSNDLLRRLNETAPGTYQHSIGVMGMAEACARAIDADVALIRAGALYHDIGKTANPACFIENQALLMSGAEAGFHSDLKPEESAKFIISHVTDGMEMAKEARLPKVVSDFILTHHGDTVVSFFYNKFLSEGGDPSMKGLFTYPGRKPATKEQVILMLCDSVEAGARTVGAKDPSAFDVFVDSIVSGKVSEGQLSESDMTYRELQTVTDVLKSYLRQLYHKRIAYPKAKQNNTNQ